MTKASGLEKTNSLSCLSRTVVCHKGDITNSETVMFLSHPKHVKGTKEFQLWQDIESQKHEAIACTDDTKTIVSYLQFEHKGEKWQKNAHVASGLCETRLNILKLVISHKITNPSMPIWSSKGRTCFTVLLRR